MYLSTSTLLGLNWVRNMSTLGRHTECRDELDDSLLAAAEEEDVVAMDRVT